MDFDRCIMALADQQYQAQHGVPLPADGQDYADNAARAEQAKVRLSKADKAQMMVVGERGPLRITVTREEFETAISNLCGQIRDAG